MGQALYRKYRSKSLDDVIGQEHITDTLKQALKRGQLSHAYLFTGPRGVGKTSVARILAHAVNELDYSDDSMHLDIIEIDAASNRRIDEIRDLRDKVHIAPTSGKYKVYIIDEVHMLTREAFNALLKTLEEPPEHVIFILATTEAHKLPETIVSRTQRFSFRPIEHAKVHAHLRAIADKEKIAIDDEALALIAEHGEGSFRDSISLLDQASTGNNKITAETVYTLLGKAPIGAIGELLASCEQGSISKVIHQIQGLSDQGVHAPQIAKQLGELIRSQLADNKLALEPQKATKLLQKLINVPASADPQRWLEVVLIETAISNNSNNTGSAAAKPQVSQAVIAKESTPKIESQPPKITKPKISEKKTKDGSSFDIKKWPEVIEQIKKTHNTLYSILRMAEASYENPRLTLVFGFSFHLKHANEAKNKQILSGIIDDLYGETVEVICEIGKKKPAAAPKEDSLAKSPADMESISSIFGTAEIMQD